MTDTGVPNLERDDLFEFTPDQRDQIVDTVGADEGDCQLDEAVKKGLVHYLEGLGRRLAERACQIADGETPDVNHLGTAIDQLIRPVETTQRAWWERFLDRFKPVILVSTLLAVAFGLLGYFAQINGNAEQAAGFQDVAKIFAGAIVGAAAATGASRHST